MVAAAAVFVPVGMMVHLNDLQIGELQESVGGLRQANRGLVVERDSFKQRAWEADGLEMLVESIGGERDDLALQVAGFMGKLEVLDGELAKSRVALGGEKVAKAILRKEVGELNSQVADLRRREDSLHGIIDLLEGEVASTERRLQKLVAGGPQAAFYLSGFDQNRFSNSNDPAVAHENERLQNALRSHDGEVTELLGEIGILNQELEIAREAASRTARPSRGIAGLEVGDQ